jgi:hypothetical protein
MDVGTVKAPTIKRVAMSVFRGPSHIFTGASFWRSLEKPIARSNGPSAVCV